MTNQKWTNANFNVDRIDSFATAKSRLRHALKKQADNNEHLDHSKDHLNKVYGMSYEQVINELNTRLAKNKLGQQAKPMTELCSSLNIGTDNPELAYEWATQSLEFFKANGFDFVSATLHMNETNPHLHLFKIDQHLCKHKSGKQVMRWGSELDKKKLYELHGLHEQFTAEFCKKHGIEYKQQSYTAIQLHGKNINAVKSMNEHLEKQLLAEEKKINKSTELQDAYELAKEVASKKTLFGIKEKELKEFKENLNNQNYFLGLNINKLELEAVKLRNGLKSKQEQSEHLELNVLELQRATAWSDNEFAKPLELWDRYVKQQEQTERSKQQEQTIFKAYQEQLDKALDYAFDKDIDVFDKKNKVDWKKFDKAKDKRQAELEHEKELKKDNGHEMTW